MQTRLGSFVESATNIVIGYIVALASQLAVFPMFDIHVSLGDNLAIGAWFTAISLTLWSSEGDAVWSPFDGIGSEGVQSLRMNRRFFGTELNPVYFASAVGHLRAASREGSQMSIFDVLVA